MPKIFLSACTQAFPFHLTWLRLIRIHEFHIRVWERIIKMLDRKICKT